MLSIVQFTSYSMSWVFCISKQKSYITGITLGSSNACFLFIIGKEKYPKLESTTGHRDFEFLYFEKLLYSNHNFFPVSVETEVKLTEVLHYTRSLVQMFQL